MHTPTITIFTQILNPDLQILNTDMKRHPVCVDNGLFLFKIVTNIYLKLVFMK